MASSRWNALRARLPPRLLALAPDLQNGLRAAIATLGPFLLVGVLHDASLAWAGLGGWLGTLADPGGTRGARARQLVVFAIAGASVLVAGELAGASPWLGALALGIGCFATSLLRALGAAGASLGTLLAIVLAVALGRAGHEPLRDGLYFAAGTLQAVLLSTIVWPVGLHAPLRREVARVHRGLADYADALVVASRERVPSGDPRWSSLARAHRSACRRAIDEARALAVALRARATGASPIGGSLEVLVGMAEARLALIITLGEELEVADGEASGHEAALSRAASVDRAIAHALVARAAPSAPVPVGPIDGVGARLAQMGAEALELAAGLEGAEDAGPWIERGGRWEIRPALRALRDALSPRSIFFRHAVRVAVAGAAAMAIGKLASPAHAHWVAITAIAVLQPYPGATWGRAVERVIGTVLGSALALAITVYVHDPRLVAAIMFPLSVAAVATRARSYRLFTFFLTPVFVLIADRGHGDWHVALERAGDAGLGGLIAAVAAIVVFPSWERERIPDALADALSALAAYARAIAATDGEVATLHAARIDARRRVAASLAAAETSMERMLSEPRLRGRGAARALDAIVYARRLAGALTALASVAPERAEAPLAGLGSAIADELDRLAAAARDRRVPVPAALPELDAAIDPAVRGHAENVLRYLALLEATPRSAPAPVSAG